MKKVCQFIFRYKYVILLILLYGLMYMQMGNVFFYGDDFEVLYPVYNDRSNFIDVFRFSLQKMSYFWNDWSGRVVGHFIVSFGLSFFGINFFRFLNPIMVFILILLCLKILKLFVNFDIKKYLFFVSLVVFGVNLNLSRETLYWAYGGILYVWGFVLLLTVIYNVYRYYINNKKIPNLLFGLLLLLCIFQIFILEQLSFLLIAFFSILIFDLIKKKKKNNQIFTFLIISVICFIIFMLSPGNVDRTEPLVQELINYSNL